MDSEARWPARPRMAGVGMGRPSRIEATLRQHTALISRSQHPRRADDTHQFSGNGVRRLCNFARGGERCPLS